MMMDFAFTQARAKEVASPASCEGGQVEAATAKPLNASLPLTADGMDKMYHQLAEIHAIAAAQLAECACWCRSNRTSSLVWVGPADRGPPRWCWHHRPLRISHPTVGLARHVTGPPPGSPGGHERATRAQHTEPTPRRA
jgi:hypothetical protein